MKILWITDTYFDFVVKELKINTNSHGSWSENIAIELIKRNKDIQLIIPQFVNIKGGKSIVYETNNIKFYSIFEKENIFDKINKFIDPYFLTKNRMHSIKKIVKDEKPDLIQVFGVENSMSAFLVKNYASITVIWWQGVMNSVFENFKYFDLNIFDFKNRNTQRVLNLRKMHEDGILKNTNFFIGRTELDKSISLIRSNAEYFHVDELIRKPFYNIEWKGYSHDKLEITVIFRPSLYKSFYEALKIFKLIQRKNRSVRLNLIGKVSIKDIKKLNRFIFLNKIMNVTIHGHYNEFQIRDILINSKVLLYPSYADNSPNVIVESQLIGVPVLCYDVGGISSIVLSESLIPVGEKEIMALKCLMLLEDNIYLRKVSNSNKKIALIRNSPEKIIIRLSDVYDKIKDLKNNVLYSTTN